MAHKKTNALTKSLEGIGSAALFAMRLLTDAFRAPFEMAFIWQELADQGWRSLPLIVSSGLALGFVMTMHTRTELIRFGASAWIPTIQSLSFFVEIGPLLAALLDSGPGRRRYGRLACRNASDRTNRRDRSSFR